MVLVVDDEVEILDLVQAYLARDGYRVQTTSTGSGALEIARNLNPDLIILDILLPEMDGLEVCRQLRHDTLAPILFLSAKGDDVDKILGLGVGADDYISKPFSPSELVARVKAHLRRNRLLKSVPAPAPNLLEFDGLKINLNSHEVQVMGQEVALASKEFQLLRFLALHPNQVMTKERLLERIWGYEGHGDARTLMVHIRNLRKKLEEDPSTPRYIATVWGTGYKFIGKVSSP